MTALPQILEVVVLNVHADTCEEFTNAFQNASAILTSIPGYISHDLHRSAEVSSSYILLIHWHSLGNHTISFRQSPDYDRWHSALDAFYDPLPALKHYYGPSLVNLPADSMVEVPALPIEATSANAVI